ncbi:MAG: alpha/beta hydrolase [Microthrixaceae bacterium]
MKRAIGVLAGATAVGVAVAGVRHARRSFEGVPGELRSPLLLVPFRVDERVLGVARAAITRPTPPVAGTTVRELLPGPDGPPVRLLVIEPEGRDRPGPAVFFIHGGGLVMGAPDGSVDVLSRLARDSGTAVVATSYRLAPEHPFPAAIDDCAASLAWVHGHAADLGIDPGRIAVGGASAGGGLAASLCQRARDEGGPPVPFQLLVYPMLDDRTVLHPPPGRFAVWTPRSNRFGWTSYLGHAPGSDPLPPYAAAARCADLSGLPPAWIGVGDRDLFQDEDVTYARRLEDAGVEVELVVVPGMYHGADAIAAASDISARFIGSMADALREALAEPVPA